MAYRLDPELVERRTRLLDAPPTLATKRRLAIVDDLIAGRSPARHVELRTPCAEDWDAMAGGDQLRRCLRCDRDVHDLDGMAPRDAGASSSGHPPNPVLEGPDEPAQPELFLRSLRFVDRDAPLPAGLGWRDVFGE